MCIVHFTSEQNRKVFALNTCVKWQWFKRKINNDINSVSIHR